MLDYYFSSGASYGYLGYIIFMLPALLFTLIAQLSVSGAFRKYNALRNSRGMTGADAARAILDRGGLSYVRIERTSGSLSDHFDPTQNVIRLSSSVYDSPTVGAVGVAAHEAGHAMQYHNDYAPIKLRSALIPVCNSVARFAPLLLLVGLIFDIFALYVAGIIAFSVVVLLQLVTLPVEFNASRRAMEALGESGVLSSGELPGARRVLTAAAMTYVAAMFTSLMQLLYYISRFRGNRRN